MSFVDIPSNPAPQGAEIVWLEGAATDQKIRVCVVPSAVKNARGTVLVCPGRTEFIEKYFEVARDLQERRFACVIIDWPGQGLSYRLTDNPLAGHIDSFSNFMDTLDLVSKNVCAKLPNPQLAVAHSMGGAILLKAMKDRIFEPKVAAFSAPMFGIRFPSPGLGLIASLMCAIGRTKSAARESTKPEIFETNPVTNCRSRWDIYRNLVENEPKLQLGAPTWGWINQSKNTCDSFLKPKALDSIKSEVLIATAGQELLVDNRSHEIVASNLKKCTHITVKNAKHEILMEEDESRNEFWTAFDRTLKKVGI